jgi:hypothetical protein
MVIAAALALAALPGAAAAKSKYSKECKPSARALTTTVKGVRQASEAIGLREIADGHSLSRYPP